ncbi:hypothetical protein Psesu_0052 [Pseudoxanthomonas suwonensis 11-1]|uniref:DUF998 domain-containing protein n=1 Tax=Pseudoxanthomonas suwonensis (strain 11-1) TaxID=743721 RepID=E6WP16_PSEUU|nr:DUF998 domain-containing protein [Pseudoxanthomonas suwonensis]ADV25915.1 hypothetical protein Psesu_0052 [Pseudoxanthomonas suwonensis 11-1]
MTIQPSRDATASLLVLASVFHFLLAAVAVQFLRPGYDPWQAPLSLYLSGEWGAWLRCAYYGLALGVAVLAVQVHRSLLPAARHVLVPVLLVIGAAALAVTAMWPGPAPGYPVDELGVLVHRISAMSAFLLVGSGMLLQSATLRHDPRWRATGRILLPLAMLAFAGLWAHALWRELPRGASQKAVIALYLAWLGLCAWQLRAGTRR